MKIRRFLLLLILTGCASSAPDIPYPAFVQSDELADVFIAALPGIRAKQFAGDLNSLRASYRIVFPADWKGSTGAAPGKSVELFVVSGEITLGSMTMKSGSYAFIPPGFTGTNISTSSSAVVLYYVDDPNPASVIQTPILLDSNLLDWRPASEDPADFGFSVKELRMDPGSGVRVWLMRIDPGASQLWRQSSVTEDGYLVSGNYRHSECVDGQVLTYDYLPGGYFARPAGAVHGGPEAEAVSSSVWFLRRMGMGNVQAFSACTAKTP